jgi:hypothetical protein
LTNQDRNETKKYKVAFYSGHEVTIKTRMEKGYAWLDDKGLYLDGPSNQLFISKTEVLSAEIFKLHGTASVIRVEHRGGTLFLSVIRFLIGGQFMLVNFYGTLKLQEQLEAIAPHQ